jgi:hypothetical protein
MELEDEVEKSHSIPDIYLHMPARYHQDFSYNDCIVSARRTDGRCNWYSAQKSLFTSNQNMLTLRMFVDFLSILRSGKVYGSDGYSRVSHRVVDAIVQDVLGSPGAEWLDTYFFCAAKQKVSFAHENFTIHHESTLGSYRKQSVGGISFANWVEHATIEGLPSHDCSDGGVRYFPPSPRSVCSFEHDGSSVRLNCSANQKEARASFRSVRFK